MSSDRKSGNSYRSALFSLYRFVAPVHAENNKLFILYKFSRKWSSHRISIYLSGLEESRVEREWEVGSTTLQIDDLQPTSNSISSEGVWEEWGDNISSYHSSLAQPDNDPSDGCFVTQQEGR